MSAASTYREPFSRFADERLLLNELPEAQGGAPWAMGKQAFSLQACACGTGVVSSSLKDWLTGRQTLSRNRTNVIPRLCAFGVYPLDRVMDQIQTS